MSYYASVWSQPPDGCEAIRDLEIKDPCSSELLTAYGTIVAVNILLICGNALSHRDPI